MSKDVDVSFKEMKKNRMGIDGNIRSKVKTDDHKSGSGIIHEITFLFLWFQLLLAATIIQSVSPVSQTSKMVSPSGSR